MKTCVSTYSFHRLVDKGELDLFGVIDTVHEMGIPETEENKQQIYNYLKDTIFVEDTPENKQALWNSVLAICE